MSDGGFPAELKVGPGVVPAGFVLDQLSLRHFLLNRSRNRFVLNYAYRYVSSCLFSAAKQSRAFEMADALLVADATAVD